MQKFIRVLGCLIIAVVLIPSVSFGADKAKCEGYIDCTAIGGAVCRDVCKPGEIISPQVKLMEGDHKGSIVCSECYKKDKDIKGKVVKTGKVCCVKK